MGSCWHDAPHGGPCACHHAKGTFQAGESVVVLVIRSASAMFRGCSDQVKDVVSERSQEGKLTAMTVSLSVRDRMVFKTTTESIQLLVYASQIC